MNTMDRKTSVQFLLQILINIWFKCCSSETTFIGYGNMM